MNDNEPQNIEVAPHGGAWIETLTLVCDDGSHLSHPTGVRGLKHAETTRGLYARHVAPHGGAWIETKRSVKISTPSTVAPHGGAWIETGGLLTSSLQVSSHPTGVRGLKHKCRGTAVILNLVAPHGGAWIET